MAWQLVDRATSDRDAAKRRALKRTGGKGRSTTKAAAVAAAREAHLAVAQALVLISEAVDGLAQLRRTHDTLGRASLSGAAHRRAALVHIAAGHPQEKIDGALQQMRRHYQVALELSQRIGAADSFAAAWSCLLADAASKAGKRGPQALDRTLVSIVQRSLQARGRAEIDFWSSVAQIELQQFEAIAKRKLTAAHRGLTAQYQDLYGRVTSSRMWVAVYDAAYLTLGNYLRRCAPAERTTGQSLLGLLRAFAYPDP